MQLSMKISPPKVRWQPSEVAGEAVEDVEVEVPVEGVAETIIPQTKTVPHEAAVGEAVSQDNLPKVKVSLILVTRPPGMLMGLPLKPV